MSALPRLQGRQEGRTELLDMTEAALLDVLVLVRGRLETVTSVAEALYTLTAVQSPHISDRLPVWRCLELSDGYTKFQVTKN